MSTKFDPMAAARDAMHVYALGRTGSRDEIVTDLITDVLDLASQAGMSAEDLMERAQEHLLLEAEEAGHVDVAALTVRVRVVSFAGDRMDREDLASVLRRAMESLDLAVEQEDSVEVVRPRVRIASIEADEPTPQG